jgi:hypothetical protein
MPIDVEKIKVGSHYAAGRQIREVVEDCDKNSRKDPA